MAVISVPSSATGATYSVRIAGDAPTAEEQARIDAYVAQMDATMAPVAPPAPEEEQGGGVSSAFGLGVDMLQQAYGSAIEGFGESTGIAGLRDYGAGVAEANKQQIMEAYPGLTQYDEVDDLSSALSFYGEQLAQQVPQLGVSLAGGYAGAKLGGALGSVIPGAGTAVGATIGGIGGSILANIPYFYGDNRERQKEVIEETGSNAEVSEGAALLTSLPQAALDGLVDRLLIGKIVSPSWISRGGIFTRAVKGTGAGAAVEVPTEIGQQVLNRMQAGLPIDDDEAMEEYKQVAITAGIVGGTVRGATNVVGGDIAKVEKAKADERALKDLEEDQKEEAEDAAKRIEFGDAAMAPPPAEEAPALEPAALLPAPARTAAPTPQAQPAAVATQPTQESLVTPEAPRQAQPFRWRDYTAATQAVVNAKDASVPAIQKAVSTDPKKPAPPAVAKAIRDRMAADGVIVADKKSKGGFRVVPTRVPEVDQTESYRRTLDDLQQDQQDAAAAQQKALLDARRAEQTGSKADARKFKLQADAAAEQLARVQATRQEVEARLPRATAETAVPRTEAPLSPVAEGRAAVPITEAPAAAQTVAVSDRAKRLKQSLDYYRQEAARKAAEARRLRESGKKVQLPKSDQQRIVDLERDAAADTRMAQGIQRQLARPAADIEQDRAQKAAAVAKEASVAAEAAARAPIYTAKEGQLFTALRRRLDNLGLSDVKLVAERVIRPAGAPKNALVEGMMDVDRRNGNRIIALALGVYDPKLTQQELFDAISGVMNHEVIHALRNLGLFTDGEWKTLSDLAARQRYMKVKDGKSVERGYTYLQRAQQMYANDTAEVQFEEAVAEMFRDYVAGRLKIGGKPKTLMDRIKGFFKALWGAHAEAGLTDANAIFEGVRFGDIGRRERKAAAPDGDARLSRAAAERAPSDPDFLRWASGPNGERAITDPSGKPVVYYTGTSKDQDFTSFKVGRHGGWFTTDPEIASQYAFQNDSQGFTRDGWEMVPTNTKSRVMPVFLRAANPFTGPLPQSAYAENYKRAQSDWFDTLRRQGYDAWIPADQPGLAVILRDGTQVKSAFARGTGGKADMRRYSRLIATDNPGGSWLEGKRRRAEEDMRTAAPGSFRSKGLGGPITAYMPKPVNLPVNSLSSLTGAEEEVRRAGDPRYDALAADVSRRGFLPDQDGNAVVVGVNHLGQAYLLEGNTRVAVARDFGVPSVRAEVRWFNGGELADGPFSPAAVEQLVSGDTRFSVVPFGKGAAFASRLGSTGIRSVDDFWSRWRDIMRATAGPDPRLSAVGTEGGQFARIDTMLSNLRELSDTQGLGVALGRFGAPSENGAGPDGLIIARVPREILRRAGIEPTPENAVLAYEALTSADASASSSRRFSALTVPEGTTAHGLPDVLLEEGDGSKAVLPITQKYNKSNVAKNNAAIDTALASNPDGLKSEPGWLGLMQQTFGGEYLPKTPYVAVSYASDPKRIADKLSGLTPALKDGVDRGFKHVKALRSLYDSGLATPDMTADLFIWGILSRGAGPVQQEGAYIDVIDSAKPFVEKAIREPLSDDDVALWESQVTGALQEASPGKQVTMNVNAAGRLMQAMSQTVPDTDKTVLQTVHDMMSDPAMSGPAIRRWFLSNTDAPGIDNKVVSFILLVSGRDDVLVMDRIQSRHLWDDGRFGGVNIYDGLGTDGGGLNKIMKGPRGLLVTESLENGLKNSVKEAYTSIGRPEDGSLGRFHWESWVIEGEQVVDHSTLEAVSGRTPVGFSVTEGKMATFSSGSRYIRTEKGSIMEYPLSKGGFVYMKPTTFKDFLDAIKSGKVVDDSGKRVDLPTPVIPKKFKVTDRADIPWYERPEVNRSALDALARRFQDAESEGAIYGRDARAGAGPASDGSGSARLSRKIAGRGDRDGGRGRAVRGAPPLEGAPRVQGASGPDQNLVLVAEKYARENGIDLRRQGVYVDVDEALAKRIADAFEAMEHDPSNPQVKAAYAELIKQTRAQYDALADAGYKFWFIDKDANKAYASTPWNAMRDIRKNKTMGVFPTVSGFGTREEVDVSQNPLLEETGLMWPYGGPDGPKVPVLANDLFRAVHDAFGHGIEGSGFRARGEENAWQAHIRLFTGLAKGALTTETRGQNSWLNYGPFGEQNRKAKVEDTIFADQKVGLMPEWTWKEGLAPDGEPYSPDARMSIRYAVSPITANVRQNIQANQKALMYARSSDLIARILTGTKLVKKDTAREFTDGLLRRFQDSMLPIGRMIQELSAKGMTITDAMDPYLQEELMHGVVGDKISSNQKGLYEPVVQAIKKLNVPKARVDQLIAASNAASTSGKGYVALAMEQSDSPRMVLADAYLYAKHARERNRFIKATKDKTNNSGSGMTDAEAEVILRWFEGLDAPNKQAIADMAKGIRLIVANTNQTRVDGGLIAEEAVDKDGNTVVIGSQYKFYVPLRGVTDGDVDTNEDDFTGPPGTPRYGARGREDRRALGRYDYAADLVANVFTQNQNAILRAERNKVGQSLLALLRADPSKTTAYAEVLKRAPTMRASVDGTMREVPDPRAYNDPDILVVKEDGKEVFVRFRDERVAGAMNGKNGFSPTTGASLTSAMQTVNRYLANINTSYNPEFFITNMFRDLSTAGVNINQYEMEGLTSDAIRNVKSALVGIKRVIRDNDDTSEWAKVYKDFVAAGGQNATNQFNTLADEMSNIQGILGDISESGVRGQWAAVKNSFIGKKTGSLLNMVENYNTIVENGIRVATYKALIDRGMSKQRAAQAARNVTVNFAKGGDYRQFMGAWYLFYNASLQGSFALLNAAVRSPKVRKMWAGIMVAGLLQDQLNAMLSDEDEDGEKIYDKIPQYVLEHNFILPDVFGITDRSYISIPMPYGLNMAHNLGRAVSRAARGEYDAGEATSTIFGTIGDTLNPIGGAESWANLVAPTVADPFIDILENEDFSEKPIYKEGLPFDRTPAPASQLYWSTTSPSAIWITNNLNALTGGNEVRPGFIDWSPDVVDFWFEFATGGVGRFVQRIAELPFKAADEGLSDEVARDIPFFRKIVGSVSEREDMGSYIEGAKAVLTAGEELKRAREVGDAAWAKETIQRYGKELRLVGPIKSLESALRETSKARNQINANPNIPDEQKKVLLDRIDQRRQMILSRANSLLRDAGL